ncbi:MAG: hypothetical protein JWN94_197 [Betaproteobacteria bacterium]|nr:hypothetical protein [Betaproteobacteria bacterium]
MPTMQWAGLWVVEWVSSFPVADGVLILDLRGYPGLNLRVADPGLVTFS